ncbi:TRAP transporter small permease [Aquipuribacter nitratireducens]|uniref:TRAP transporter small permease n=1 Tax=Aquipuribacter nitratireducens TaxID=650104 RepID=A0ABW0GRD2_9MICO
MAQTVRVETGHEVYRPGPVGRVLRTVELVELVLGGVLLVLILVLVSSQVVARVTPLDNPVWTGEVARFSLFWLAFGIAGYLMGREEHVTLTAVDAVLPRLGKIIVHRFSLLVVAATCLVFAYEGYDLLSSTGRLRTPAAGIPVGWLYILPTAGMLLTAARALLIVALPAARPIPHPPETADVVGTALQEGPPDDPTVGRSERTPA